MNVAINQDLSYLELLSESSLILQSSPELLDVPIGIVLTASGDRYVVRHTLSQDTWFKTYTEAYMAFKNEIRSIKRHIRTKKEKKGPENVY